MLDGESVGVGPGTAVAMRCFAAFIISYGGGYSASASPTRGMPSRHRIPWPAAKQRRLMSEGCHY